MNRNRQITLIGVIINLPKENYLVSFIFCSLKKLKANACRGCYKKGMLTVTVQPLPGAVWISTEPS